MKAKRLRIIWGVFSVGYVLLALLLVAPHWDFMDALTMHMPTVVRKTVARRAVARIFFYGYQDQKRGMARAQRTLRLDPENPTAWTYIGQIEQDSNPCDAQIAFEKSVAYADARERAEYMTALGYRDIGTTALQCGHLQKARPAIERYQAMVAGILADEPANPNLKDDVMFSHYYLSIYWSRIGDAAKARQECQIALPQYKNECGCYIHAGETGCSGS